MTIYADIKYLRQSALPEFENIYLVEQQSKNQEFIDA